MIRPAKPARVRQRVLRWVVRLLLLAPLLWPLAGATAEAEGTGGSEVEILYAQALAALAAHQPTQARLVLEHVVALNPRFAGAWLDLALATYQSGNPAAALEHLDYLRSQFTLPAALAAQVDHWYARWQTPVTTPGWEGEVLLGAGHDTNANAGLANSQLTLSLPGGNSVFDVDGAYLPHTDQFGLLTISARGPGREIGIGQLHPLVVVRTKQFSQSSGFSTVDLQPGLAYIYPASDHASWQTHLWVRHYRMGGEGLFDGLRLGVQYLQPWRDCRTHVGTEVEVRKYQRVPALGGTFFNISTGLGCRWVGGASMSGILKLGQEQAPAERPGGGNQSAELSLVYDQALSPTQSLQVSWQMASTTDQSGYSPLLDNNATRNQLRHTIALGLRQALWSQWEARLSYEYFNQRANPALFEQQGQLLMLGLAYVFH